MSNNHRIENDSSSTAAVLLSVIELMYDDEELSFMTGDKFIEVCSTLIARFKSENSTLSPEELNSIKEAITPNLWISSICSGIVND